MRLGFKRIAGLGVALSSGAVPARAQGSQGLGDSFSNLLVGVSDLLIAVSLVFVLVKVARLVDLMIRRYEDQLPPRG